MIVRAVISFVGHVNGELTPWPVDRVAELPEGVNWLDLGWVVPVEDAPQSPAAETTDEEPVKKKSVRKGKATE